MTNLCEWLGIEKKSDDLLYESAVNTTLSELQSIVSDSGATSPSTTGRHMYRFDSVLSNWWFSWCSIPDKFLVKCYEELLQKELNPQFNSIHMGGNN
jgi:hypothetical protein